MVAASIYEKRHDALRAVMRREDLSALVVFGLPGYSLMSTSTGYVRYLTGYSSRFNASMAVLPADGPFTLVVNHPFAVSYVEESFPWIGRCLSTKLSNYGKTVRGLLNELGTERVGLVGTAEMPRPLHEDLVKGDGAIAFSTADHLVDELRTCKDETEIESLRKVAHIADSMLSTLVDQLRAGLGPGKKLLIEMEYKARSLDAEAPMAWLAYGQPPDRRRYVVEELEHEVRPGDQVLSGTYVTYRGYWGHCLRMISVGEPSQHVRELHEAVVQMHKVAVAQVRVGGDARRIATEARRVGEELLPGSTDPTPFSFRFAHFLGLAYEEFPTSVAFPQPATFLPSEPPAAAGEVILRPGMTLAVHTNLALPGIGLAVMGDVYVVREAGPERLNKLPQDLFVV